MILYTYKNKRVSSVLGHLSEYGRLSLSKNMKPWY